MSNDVAHIGDNEATILIRLLTNQDGLLPREVARYILNCRFSERDITSA
jgi:hypothetical protein